MAGYSETPLVKKLGIKEGSRIAFIGNPRGLLKELGPLPPGVTVAAGSQKPLDLILLFVKGRSELKEQFAALAHKLTPSGMLWIAWPKKASGVFTDLSFEVVQRVGLEAGLVDTKICAIDAVWSGLKFVIRLKNR